MSNHTGSFKLDPGSIPSSLTMLAAGTGFTPMAKLTKRVLEGNKESRARLVFFNKTEKDIMWRRQVRLIFLKADSQLLETHSLLN